MELRFGARIRSGKVLPDLVGALIFAAWLMSACGGDGEAPTATEGPARQAFSRYNEFVVGGAPAALATTGSEMVFTDTERMSVRVLRKDGIERAEYPLGWVPSGLVIIRNLAVVTHGTEPLVRVIDLSDGSTTDHPVPWVSSAITSFAGSVWLVSYDAQRIARVALDGRVLLEQALPFAPRSIIAAKDSIVVLGDGATQAIWLDDNGTETQSGSLFSGPSPGAEAPPVTVSAGATDGYSIWMTTLGPATLSGFDAAAQPLPSVRLEFQPNGIAATSSALWVLDPAGQSVRRYDHNGTALGEVGIGGDPAHIEAFGDVVWVVDSRGGRLIRIMP